MALGSNSLLSMGSSLFLAKHAVRKSEYTMAVPGLPRCPALAVLHGARMSTGLCKSCRITTTTTAGPSDADRTSTGPSLLRRSARLPVSLSGIDGWMDEWMDEWMDSAWRAADLSWQLGRVIHFS